MVVANKCMSKITKKILQIRSAWALEALEMYRPYFPEEMPDIQRQAASLFFYVCAIDPEKEAETVCNLLTEAWKVLTEERALKTAELLDEQYRKQITGSIEFYLPYLFAPVGTRNFAMRQCVKHVLEHCRKQLKKPLSQAEREECEKRCQHLIHVRDQIKQAEIAADKIKKEWDDTHIFAETIRFRKDPVARITHFFNSPDPENDSNYGEALETKTFPDGAVLTFVLKCAKRQGQTKKAPALVAQMKAEDKLIEKAFFAMRDHETAEIEANDCVYHFVLEYYQRSNYIYWGVKHKQNRMKLEYPKNLISEILDSSYSDEPSDFMISELEAAIAGLDSRKREFVLLRYRDGKTYREIGEAWNLTASRVREVINQGVRALRTIRLSRILKGEAPSVPSNSANKEPVNNGTLIESCGFSIRLYNCLRRVGIKTLDELQKKTWVELLHIRNFGAGCQKELEEYCNTNKIIIKNS